MRFVAVVFALCFANVMECFGDDRTLVISQMRKGVPYKGEVVVKDSKTNTEFQLQGFFHNWKCEAWPQQSGGVIVTCWQLDDQQTESPWKTQVSIACDSEDLFFIDAVTLKCEGRRPSK